MVISTVNKPRNERFSINEVMVVGLNEPIDLSLDKLGYVEFVSSELNVGCSYDDAISRFKKVAARNGGNIIKITEIKELDALMEACISVKAEIYYVRNPGRFKSELAAKRSSENSRKDQDQDRGPAHLYFYRAPVVFADMMEFDIYLDDDYLCTAKSDWGKKVVVHQTGKHVLWTKTERPHNISLDIEPGESYYISCSVQIRLRKSRPYLKLEDESVGRSAYNRIVGQVLTLVQIRMN